MDLEAEELVLLMLATTYRKSPRRNLPWNGDILLGNKYRPPFGCLVGGDMNRYRHNPFIFLVGATCNCGVLVKDIVVMGLLVTLVYCFKPWGDEDFWEQSICGNSEESLWRWGLVCSHCGYLDRGKYGTLVGGGIVRSHHG